MKPLVKKNILGVGVTDASRDRVLEYVFDFMKDTDEKLFIVTPNPEIVMYSLKHEAFRKVLNTAGVALCDGAGLFWGGKLLGKTIKERITGVDFMENLCKESVRKAVTVGFLGGRNGVAERAAECLVKKYPGLRVAFVGEEWPQKVAKPQSGTVAKKENHSVSLKLWNSDTIDILFVAYGFPKQEEWIAEHLDKLPVRVMMGVGGAFDYVSGEVSRAPQFLRDLGLEWLYRLIRQPWRLKRQLVLPQFFLTVLKEKFKNLSSRT
jgi:N-acetylglucosaminyldiphosphoundecaprenol N-acetyl-beta-D-mannosaminyltransferase